MFYYNKNDNVKGLFSDITISTTIILLYNSFNLKLVKQGNKKR